MIVNPDAMPWPVLNLGPMPDAVPDLGAISTFLHLVSIVELRPSERQTAARGLRQAAERLQVLAGSMEGSCPLEPHP